MLFQNKNIRLSTIVMKKNKIYFLFTLKQLVVLQSDALGTFED
jgi:hypothetical protein